MLTTVAMWLFLRPKNDFLAFFERLWLFLKKSSSQTIFWLFLAFFEISQILYSKILKICQSQKKKFRLRRYFSISIINLNLNFVPYSADVERSICLGVSWHVLNHKSKY